MRTTKLVILSLLLGTSTLFAQENKESKPKGKAFAKIFMNFHNGLGNMNEDGGFELTRSYFGYQYQITNSLMGKVTFDVGNPSNGSKLENTAYVKNAMLTWKEGDFTVDFGLIGTKVFNTQEKFWGYRYLFKSFQDEYKWASSADMGASVNYKFSKCLSADLTFINGEGYKNLQSDNNYRTGLGLTYKPCEKVALRAYYDNYSKDDNNDALKDQNIIALFGGYKNKDFSIGAEYNMLSNYKFIDGNDLTGISAYATYNASKKVKLFGRYDNLSSDKDWNESKDGELFIAGVEYNPIKNLKISPNFRTWSPKESDTDNQSYLYLSVELSF